MTSAVMTMLGARVGSVLIGLAGLMILSRLLDPEVFGYFALGIAAFGAAQILSEFGLLQFTVRQEEALPPETAALATFVALIASGVAAAAMGGLPWLLPRAWVGRELAVALATMSVALPLVALTQQRQARLHRDLTFRRPAVAELLATACEVAVAATLALAGFGLQALALAFLAGRSAHALVFFLAAPAPRFLRPGFARWREVVGFGGEVTLIWLLTRGGNLAQLVVLTAVAGAGITGILNRAQRLFDLPKELLLNGLRPVILPAFAEGLRSGMAPSDLLAAKTERLAPLLWTAFGGLFLLAEPLVDVLLGPGWSDVVPVLQILAIGGLAAPSTLMSMKFFIAIDALRAYGRIQLVYVALRLSGVAAMAFVSLTAVAAAISFANIVRAGLFHRWYRQHLPMPAGEGYALPRAAAIAIASLIGPAALVHATDLEPLPLLILAVGLGGAVWLVAIRVAGNPLAADMSRALRAVRGAV